MTKNKGNYRTKWYDKITESRKQAFLSLFESSGSVLLGCGCTEGALTLKVAKRVRAKKLVGIDLDDTSLSFARKKGIDTIKSDLNFGFPLKDASVDIVSADQVIEHLTNVDNFTKEIHRVLKPEGYAVICTENLSSWHNIFALLLGKQAFSQCISSKFHVGNPFSPHYKKPITSTSSQHIHIFTIQGLIDIFEIYGFKVEKVRGIGYFLFPPSIGKFFERIDPIHAYFLAIKIRKPRSKG